MKAHLSLLLLSAYYALGQNTPDTSNLRGPCQRPRVRRSWHRLSNDEKSDYIRAVQCLYNSPAKGTAYFAAAKSRHDDFASLHISRATAPNPNPSLTNGGVIGPGIHFNGVFLPWHRYTTWTYETALIEECGYRGAQPFWDWTLDNPEYGSTFDASPVFDGVYGFGGNGAAGTLPELPLNETQPNGSPANVSGSCFATGPFAGIRPTLGPGYSLQTPNPHCVHRNLNVPLAQAALGWTANVVPLLQNAVFADLTHQVDFPNTGAPFGIHGGGHGGVSGEMLNLYSSINDPLFFMHHTQIDHVWWMWQALNPQKNLWAIGGPVYPNGTGETTLDYPIQMSPFTAPDTTIRTVMDTLNRDGSGVLCYVYEPDSRLLSV